MDSAKPSLELVRSLTDEHVLRTLMRHRRLTRAELAAEIGISKPTAGESVRRLVERGLVADTGERTPGGRGRGRVGSYYALAPTVGVALAVAIAPEGVVVECVDVYGDVVARAVRRADPSRVATALEEAVTEATGRMEHRAAVAGGEGGGGGRPVEHRAAVAGGEGGGGGRPVRLAVVSAADPVDRATGRLVHLPDAPFLVGDLDPVALLAPHAGGTVVVDNDVNWAASAEPDHPRDFAYLYLGAGLGCAIVHDGAIRRGRSGLAGEIAHLLTVGPGGRAIRFIELFGELGLRRPGSTAIDVDLLLGSPDRRVVATAVAGVIAAVTALADPQEVVVGGSWGPDLVGDIRAAAAELPRPVPVRATALTEEPSLAGARAAALERLRAHVTA